MKKTLLPLIILLILATAFDGYAQKRSKKNKKEKPAEEYPLSAKMGRETVHYAVIEDAPEDIKHTFISLDLSNVEVGTSSLMLGGGLDAKYQTEKFMVNGNFIREYFNMLKNSEDTTKFERSPYMHTELVGTYFLNSIHKTSKTGITMSSSTYTTTSSSGATSSHASSKGIRIPAKLNSRIGIRAGYVYHQNDDGFAQQRREIDQVRVPSIKSHSILLGVSLMKVRNITIKTQEYGERSRVGFMQFYADVLYAPSISSKIYQSINESNFVLLDDVSGYKKNPFGARIGYETIGAWGKKFYVKNSYEVGIRPSLKNNLNAYFLGKAAIGMSF